MRAPLDGSYRFHLDGADASVEVAHTEMLAPNAAVELHLGRYYPLVVTVAHLQKTTQRLRLEWTAPHGARYVVPRALLQLPTRGVAKT